MILYTNDRRQQWFGNLVTMKWWEELWLKEGFAKYMENYIGDQLYPEWNLWTDFFTSTYRGALQGDALRTSHPIEVSVTSSADLADISDSVSLQKGASLLRFLSDWMGEGPFT